MESHVRKNKVHNGTGPWYKVSIKAVNDPSLSLIAKGVFALLSSMANEQNEVINFKAIFSEQKDGRDQKRNAINELIKAGYLSREQLRGSNGFEGVLYRVHPLGRSYEE